MKEDEEDLQVEALEVVVILVGGVVEEVGLLMEGEEVTVGAAMVEVVVHLDHLLANTVHANGTNNRVSILILRKY